jgi:2-polyprenyl-3-methyl-5-hydroxy-6-metoxy-1,4-benzoquinol methylase
MSYRDQDYKIDLSVDNAHARVIRLIGRDKKVLELGCSTGYMSKVLTESFGCSVTGIECDAASASAARTVCSRVIEGDLETLDWESQLGDERFDVIVCADVLEHLRDPAHLLQRLGSVLSTEGYVVASIPNITHASVIMELIRGRFPYCEEGLLDGTHLRFFSIDTVYETFERAGLVIAHLERFSLEPQHTEFKTSFDGYPPELVQLLAEQPESRTYQFILTARPAEAVQRTAVLKQALTKTRRAPDSTVARAVPETDPSVLPQAMTSSPQRLEGVIEAFLSRMHFVEQERLREAQKAHGLKEALVHKEKHSQNLQAEIERLAEEIHRRDAAVQQLQDELAKIRSSFVWRILSSLRKSRS